eukprot:gnl/TRDRNA2_/TRDRNA2_86401_c0_seq4.p1 gnl/TRDRNA2_/TRDRNA2_86401_c0~~gnl/TRDRNA2_/TRDRNA2_86401_c0_seq4.p1  ORF type:complete len:266 (-),score=50.35 gnl/TRDRNA2_/TRDRNA2_86401_c0_seq4:26-823(-)
MFDFDFELLEHLGVDPEDVAFGAQAPKLAKVQVSTSGRIQFRDAEINHRYKTGDEAARRWDEAWKMETALEESDVCKEVVHPLTEASSRWVKDVRDLSHDAFGMDVLPKEQELEEAFDAGRLQVSCWSSDDETLGFVVFGPRSQDEQHLMEVHYLAVRERSRRKGGGLALLEHVQQTCQAGGIPHIVASCRLKHLEFYLKLGFYFENGPTRIVTSCGRTLDLLAGMQHLKFDAERKFKRQLPDTDGRLCPPPASRDPWIDSLPRM